MQLAWLAFRAEMKYYENKEEEDSYWIRSDLNDKLARDVDRTRQIDEIERKIPDIKNMLQIQIDNAENLGVTQTAEFEEAFRKLSEIATIEEKLRIGRAKIKREHRCYNFWICFSLILLGLMVWGYLYYLFKQPDMDLVIR